MVQDFEKTVDFYHHLGIGSGIAAAGFVLLAAGLFFFLDIPLIYTELRRGGYYAG